MSQRSAVVRASSVDEASHQPSLHLNWQTQGVSCGLILGGVVTFLDIMDRTYAGASTGNFDKRHVLRGWCERLFTYTREKGRNKLIILVGSHIPQGIQQHSRLEEKFS